MTAEDVVRRIAAECAYAAAQTDAPILRKRHRCYEECVRALADGRDGRRHRAMLRVERSLEGIRPKSANGASGKPTNCVTAPTPAKTA